MIVPSFSESASVRSLQTMLRTIARAALQQPKVISDGVYGPATTAAVAAFQRLHGLPVTGETDENTWDAVVQAFELARVDTAQAAPIRITLNAGQVLRRGCCSHRIYLVQTMLTVFAELTAEIPAPEHTGVLDDQTRRAVLAFQLKAGLHPTGEVDKHTWKALALQFAAASDTLSRREDNGI